MALEDFWQENFKLEPGTSIIVALTENRTAFDRDEGNGQSFKIHLEQSWCSSKTRLHSLLTSGPISSNLICTYGLKAWAPIGSRQDDGIGANQLGNVKNSIENPQQFHRVVWWKAKFWGIKGYQSSAIFQNNHSNIWFTSGYMVNVKF